MADTLNSAAVLPLGGSTGWSVMSGTPAAPATVVTTMLAVENMHCGACMRKVETALLTVPHVVSARANLSTRRVAVVSQGGPAPLEGALAAVAAAGFKATALAPDAPQADAGAEADLLRRLGVAGFAAANIMLLSVAVWSGADGDMPSSMQTLFHWLSALIAVPAVAYAGQPFFKSAYQALSSGRLNMDVPISLGVTLATAMSLFQTTRASHQVYFDAAVTLLFFLLIGRTLELRVRRRAAEAAENLLGLRTPFMTVLDGDGGVRRVATATVEPGTRFLVAAGERVPLDASLARGTASIDQSLITGESLPRTVAVGDQLYAGTIALSGPFEAVASATAENTLLAEIARLIHAGTQARGRYVRLADRAARLYAPAVHVLGATTFIGWMAIGHGWEPALTAAIAVLIITCPCALALAVPAVQVAASSRLFRSGVILKAADGLERLAEIDTVVLDKTGTLTVGEPRLSEACVVSDDVLQRAAGLAVQSRHPYSKAIVRAATERGLNIEVHHGVEEIAGSGLQAGVGEASVKLGSAAFCEVPIDGRALPALWYREGNSAPHAFLFEDRLRSDAADIVVRLKARGITVEILSGDRAEAVAETARAAGIAEWRAAQRPDEKIARLEQLKSLGRKVLMVGDGLNDAPALAAGHASLSPSTAADVSQTASDAVFQGERLAPVIELLDVAHAARRRALENFAIAIGYNIVFVPLAMAGLVTPLIAAAAMSGSSIAVTLNALRTGRASKELAA